MLTGCTAFGGMRAALAILGVGLLAACSGSSSSSGPSGGMPPDDGSGSMVADLGEWNSLEPGSLDISDANGVLRAYYDDSGNGDVMAATPVQPEGTGSATWSGKWSGKVDVNPEPYADIGLNYAGLSRSDLAALGGDARITAYFGNSDVQAELTYLDTGLDGLGLGSITSERVAVNDGTFTTSKTQSATFSVVGRGGYLG